MRLNVKVVEYYIPGEEQFCHECGEPLHIMNNDVRKELKTIPVKVMVYQLLIVYVNIKN